MEIQIVKVDPKEFGLEENKALELTSGLTAILTEREVLKNAYLDVIELELTEENIKIFKELRLKIVKNRTQGIEKWHKVTKDFFLTGGRFVDSVKNKESFENVRMEDALMEKEKHFENLEKARLKTIHDERVLKLFPFGYEIGNVDFSGMDENMFNAILLGAEKTYNDKIEAERKAEIERIEKEQKEKLFLERKETLSPLMYLIGELTPINIESTEEEFQDLLSILKQTKVEKDIEQEKIKQENEKLKKENEAKEKQLELERIEAEKIRLAEKTKADAELAEQKRLAEIESKKQADIIAKQKADADKLAAELKAKADAEEKEKKRIEAENKAKLEAEKKAAKAPDKIKIKAVIDSLPIIECSYTTDEGEKVFCEIRAKYHAFKEWAYKQVDTI